MKKIFTLRTTLVVVLAMCWMPSLKAQLFYQDSHLFIGQKPNNWNSVGSAPGVYIGPNWGMEFSEGGLNIWRPQDLQIGEITNCLLIKPAKSVSGGSRPRMPSK